MRTTEERLSTFSHLDLEKNRFSLLFSLFLERRTTAISDQPEQRSSALPPDAPSHPGQGGSAAPRHQAPGTLDTEIPGINTVTRTDAARTHIYTHI